MTTALRWSAVGVCSLLVGGCYTVLMGPRAPKVEETPVAVAPEGQQSREPATLGRFGADRGVEDDFYRYPGAPGGYGYGGYPFAGFGYSSGAGYYGYGPYPGYGYYGYGPYSYGYDPYYQNTSGYNVPVGYELVTQSELDELRASREALDELQSDTRTPEEIEQQRLEEERQREEVWNRRVQSRLREAPTVTPREQPPTTTGTTAPATYTGSSSSGGSTSSGSGDSSAAKSSAKPSAQPKKTRR
ncbi:MAG: hypothetical protein AB1505_05390 [Candidatus Latescibacterota bacterium]